MALAERRECSKENGSSVRNLLYLAAAVSDFYIPNGDLPVHKIQSSEGAPSIQVTWPGTNQTNEIKIMIDHLNFLFLIYFLSSCSVCLKCWSHLLSSGRGRVLWSPSSWRPTQRSLSPKREKLWTSMVTSWSSATSWTPGKERWVAQSFQPCEKCTFQVLLVFKDEMEEVRLTDAELETGVEIEEKIISRLIEIVQQL